MPFISTHRMSDSSGRTPSITSNFNPSGCQFFLNSSRRSSRSGNEIT